MLNYPIFPSSAKSFPVYLQPGRRWREVPLSPDRERFVLRKPEEGKMEVQVSTVGGTLQSASPVTPIFIRRPGRFAMLSFKVDFCRVSDRGRCSLKDLQPG